MLNPVFWGGGGGGGEREKNINLSLAELAQRMVVVKTMLMLTLKAPEHSRSHSNFFLLYFSKKIRLDILRELSS